MNDNNDDDDGDDDDDEVFIVVLLVVAAENVDEVVKADDLRSIVVLFLICICYSLFYF